VALCRSVHALLQDAEDRVSFLACLLDLPHTPLCGAANIYIQNSHNPVSQYCLGRSWCCSFKGYSSTWQQTRYNKTITTPSSPAVCLYLQMHIMYGHNC